MTKDYYIQTCAGLMERLAEVTERGDYNEARIIYGRLAEIIDIALDDAIIERNEWYDAQEQANDCFYDNL